MPHISVYNPATNTYPMVYHEPGEPSERIHRHLKRLTKKVLSGPRQNIGCPADLSIVTWNNYPTVSILEKTCAHLGIPVYVYGRNIKDWKSNYENKLSLMIQACKETTTPYIMGLDSRDILLLARPHDILDAFKRMNVDMLLGASTKTLGFYRKIPDLHDFFASLTYAHDSPFIYLNGGQWIARREYALSFFERARTYPPRPEKPTSDQIILAHTLCHDTQFQSGVRLDTACEIFQINSDETTLVIDNIQQTPQPKPRTNKIYIIRFIRQSIDRFIGMVGIQIKRISPRLHAMIKSSVFSS